MVGKMKKYMSLEKGTTSEHLVKIGFYSIIILGSTIMALPFVWMIFTSVKQPDELYRLPLTLLPDNFFNMENYIEVFKRQNFLLFFLNSIIISVGCTTATLFFSSLSGYAFAKFEFPGKNIFFFVFILAVLMVPFEVIIIPLYLFFNRIGLVDTYLGIMGPSLLSAFGVFIMRQFIVSIPSDYMDAARIDGYSEIGIFIKIILPMSIPALATLGTIKFIWTWNDFLWPLVMVSTEKMRTVMLGLATYTGMWHTEFTVVTAAAFLSVIPLLVVFLFLQNFVIKGMTMTGLKG